MLERTDKFYDEHYEHIIKSKIIIKNKHKKQNSYNKNFNEQSLGQNVRFYRKYARINQTPDQDIHLLCNFFPSVAECLLHDYFPTLLIRYT